MFKLLVCWSREACYIYDKKGLKGLKVKKDIKKGGEWDMYEFKTRAEREAFCNGADLSNGWDNPYFENYKD